MMTTNITWQKLLTNVLTNGTEVNPRGATCKEVIGAQSTIKMKYPVVTIKAREMGYRFMCAEAYWILTGDSCVSSISPYSKIISRFSDDGYRFQGAYGPKVMEQMRYVVDILTADPDSRQAVINIWREMPGPGKDIPCTLSLQFLLRRSQSIGIPRLSCVVTMRSSDLWLGWVYDIFNFSMISAYVCLRLKSLFNDIDLGELILTAGSQHLYATTMNRAYDCSVSENNWKYAPLKIFEFDKPDDLLYHLACLKDHKWSDLKSPFLSELEQLNVVDNTSLSGPER